MGFEEHGVHVALGECIAKVLFGEVTQYYFPAAFIGGRLGAVNGEEFAAEEGIYELVWLQLCGLAEFPLNPHDVA